MPDEYITDVQTIRKLRTFFLDCKKEGGVKQPFVVGVELSSYSHGPEGPKQTRRFYGCFGVRPGNRLQYELLGLESLFYSNRLRNHPIEPKPNDWTSRFVGSAGLKILIVTIVCQAKEVYKFQRTDLWEILYGADRSVLYELMDC